MRIEKKGYGLEVYERVNRINSAGRHVQKDMRTAGASFRFLDFIASRLHLLPDECPEHLRLMAFYHAREGQ